MNNLRTFYCALVLGILSFSTTLAQTEPAITINNGQVTISSTGGATLWYNYSGGYPLNNTDYSKKATPDSQGNATASFAVPTEGNNEYLKIECTEILEEHKHWNRQIIQTLNSALSAQTDYIITARIKTSTPVNIQPWISGNNNEIIYIGAMQPISTEWSTYTWQFNTEERTTLNKFIFCFGDLLGDIYFDDIILRPSTGNTVVAASHFYGGDASEWELITANSLSSGSTNQTTGADCIIQAMTELDGNFSQVVTKVIGSETILDIDFSSSIINNVCTGAIGSISFEGTTGFELGYTDTITGTTHHPQVLRLGKGTAKAAIPDELLPGSTDAVTVEFDFWAGALFNRYAFFSLTDAQGARIGGSSFDIYDKTANITDFGTEFHTWIASPATKTNNQDICVDSNKSHITLTFDFAHNKMKAKVSANGGEHETDEYPLQSRSIPQYFTVGSGYIVNDRRCWFDNLKITKVVSNQTIQATTYQIRYLCGETAIKESITCNGYAGQSIVISDEECPKCIEFEGQTYYYTSDDASSQTIQENGQTVVTIQYHEEYIYQYTLQAVDASQNVLKTLKSGSFRESQQKDTVYYPKFILVDNLYYDIQKNDADPYYGIILTQGGTYSFVYNPCDAAVEYYNEIENMNLHLGEYGWMATANAPMRYSEGDARRLNYKQCVGSAPLAGGLYSVTLYARNAKQHDYNGIGVRVSNSTEELLTTYQEFASWTSAECGEHTIEGLIVPPGYHLQIGEINNTNNELELDYVRITRMGDIQTASSSDNLRGWKNFYDANQSWEVDEFTSIYRIEQESETELTVYRITDSKYVPQGEPVLLRTLNDVDNVIAMKPVETTGATITGNALLASAVETQAPSGTSFYRFAYNKTQQKLGWFKVSKIPANSPYLSIASTNAPSFRFIDGLDDWGDYPTAIFDVLDSPTDDEPIYNLQGTITNRTSGLTIRQGVIQFYK